MRFPPPLRRGVAPAAGPPSVANGRRAGGRRAAVFVVVNAGLQSALLLSQGRRFLAVADPAFTGADLFVFDCHAAAVCGALALLLFAGNRLGALGLEGLGLQRSVAERAAGAGLVAATLVVHLVVVAEVLTYTILGVHAYSPFVLDNIAHPSGARRDLQLGAAALAEGALAVAVLAAALALLALAFRRWEWRFPGGWRRSGTALVRVGLGVWAAAALTAAVPLARQETRQRPMAASLFLWRPDLLLRQFQRALTADFTYRTPPPGQLPRLRRPVSILTLVVETFRADAFTPELMPALTEFARSRRCLVSGRTWSASHSTSYSLFSVLSGLSPEYADYVAEQRRALYPFELLKANGYSILGASASKIAYYPQLAGVLRELPQYTEIVEGADRDRPLVDWFAQSYARLDRSRPYYAFLFFYTPHHNYYFPPRFERHRPVLPFEYDHFSGDDRLRGNRVEIRNRYLNSILYADSLLAETLAGVRADLDAGKLAVVVTGDHGEEFWEHGTLGHGQARFENERVRTPLLICLPGVEPPPAPAVVSQVDIWPTLVDYLSPDPPVDASAWSSGVSLLRPPSDERYAVVSGHGFPYRSQSAALVTARGKLWLEKESEGVDRDNAFLVRRVTDLEDRPAPELRGELEPALAALRMDMKRFLDLRGGAGAVP